MTDATQSEAKQMSGPTVEADQKPLSRRVWFWLLVLFATFATPTPVGHTIPGTAAAKVGALAAISLIAWVTWRVSNKSMWLTVVVITLFIFAGFSRSPERPGHSARAGIVSGPPGSEFTVRFPQDPKTTHLTAYGGGVGSVAVERMEFEDEVGLLRAEFIPYGPGFPGIPDKDAAFAALRKWGEGNGLSIVQLEWEDTALGKCASLRGTKVLESDAGSEAVTYSSRMIVGARSCLTLSVGGRSSSYPFPGALEFLGSAARR